VSEYHVSPQNAYFRFTASTAEKKKRHFDGSFIYVIFPTVIDTTIPGNVKVGLAMLGKTVFFLTEIISFKELV